MFGRKAMLGRLSAFINFEKAVDGDMCFAIMQSGYEIRPGQGFIEVKIAYQRSAEEGERSQPNKEKDGGTKWRKSWNEWEGVNTWDGWAHWQEQQTWPVERSQAETNYDAWANWCGTASQ